MPGICGCGITCSVQKEQGRESGGDGHIILAGPRAREGTAGVSRHKPEVIKRKHRSRKLSSRTRGAKREYSLGGSGGYKSEMSVLQSQTISIKAKRETAKATTYTFWNEGVENKSLRR